MVNSLSCPKMTNPSTQTCPDLSNTSPMSDINMSSVMGMGLINGQSLLGASSLAGLSIPDDCKPPEVKLEVLDELFGSGWADHGLSIAASPSSESSLSPSPPMTFEASSFLSTASPQISLKAASSLLAVSSGPPASVMAAAAARTLKVPLPGDFLTSFANSFTTTAPASVVSAAMAAAENGSLQIIIPSSATTPGPDTTSSGTTNVSFKSPTGLNSAESSAAKKTVFTAKGKNCSQISKLHLVAELMLHEVFPPQPLVSC